MTSQASAPLGAEMIPLGCSQLFPGDTVLFPRRLILQVS